MAKAEIVSTYQNMVKDLQPDKKSESINTDLTDFWNKSESSVKFDSKVDGSFSAAEANCLPKKSLFNYNVNDFNFCKNEEDELDNSSHPIDLFNNGFNPIYLQEEEDNNMYGITDAFNWNEVFNMSSNYLNPQLEDNQVDYFNLLQEQNY
jgi:hypothetical protein